MVGSHLQSYREPATLAAHMDMMVKAGAGVVALSWYPPGLSDENGSTFNLNFSIVFASRPPE